MSEEVQIVLPERFKRVEYISDTGTQWIDTGYIPDSETGMYIHAKQNTSTDGFPFGCGLDATGVSAPRMLINGNTGIFYNAWILFSTIGSGTKGNEFVGHTNWLNCKKSEVTRLDDGRILTYNLRETLSFTPTAPLFLFRCNTGSANRVWKGRIYEAKISQGNEIVRHFVPVFDTIRSEACMYEVKEGKAYYNKGTGVLEVKFNLEDEQLGILHKLPEGFTKVKYLIANGNQYIDTNYVPTNETGYYIEAQSYSSSKDVHFFGCVNGTTFGTGVGRLYFCTGSSSAFYNCGWGDGQFALSSSFNSSHMRQELKYELNFLNRREAKLSINETDFIYKNIPNLNFAPSNSIYLFGTNMGGVNIHQPLLGRIDMFLISEGDQIVRQFVPCLDADGIPCMYELYTGTVHYNQGSSQFSYPRMYINDPINLPTGYTKCVYLQSDGTQWIDTKVVPDDNTGVYVKTQHLSYGDFIEFGAQESVAFYPLRFDTRNKMGGWAFGSSWQNAFSYNKADDLIYTSTMNLYNDRTINFWSDDTNWSGLISTSFKGAITRSLWLFSYNTNGTSIDTTYGKFGGRIFRAKITQDDYLIRDFVPCLDADNRPCMYDLVTQEPYYNQSEGTEFAYCVEHQLPSDFIKLKYLEDTGTQYINIGIIPTNETGLYVDASQTKHANAHAIGSGIDTNSTGFGVPRFLKGTANSSGFMWKGWNSYGGIGNGTRFEGCLNLYNDRKATLKTAGTTERINNLGELGFIPTVPLYMFRTNYASHGNWNGRIYRAKITQGTELIRDFVPAYDQRTHRPCMYDLINNVAYYNDGEGEFIYNRDFEGTYKGYTGLSCIGNKLGSDYDPINEKLPSGYTRVEFLESKNGEYIKLGLNATNFSSYIKFSMLTPSSFNGSGPAYIFTTPSNTYRVEGWPYDSTMTWEPHWVLFDTENNKNQWGGMIGGINYGECAFCKIDLTSKKITVSSPYASKSVVSTIKDEFVNLEHGEITLFPRNNSVRWFSRIYFFQGNYDGVEATNLIPSLDENGKPCFYDIIRQISLYNEKENTDFIIGLKTLSHALQLYLPDSGGTIHLSLPTNDKTEIYEEKIRTNNPNWEITFYYH